MASVSTLIGSGINPLAAVAMSTGTVGTVAAAGSTATDAAVVTADCTYVTAADGTKGAKLFDCEIGSEITVINHGSSTLKLYPPTSQQLNLLTATTGNIGIGANRGALCKKMTNALWGVVYS
jgi:hypothetical protein